MYIIAKVFAHPFSPRWRLVEKNSKEKDVHFGETTLEKLLILLLYSLVRAQANLFPRYFLRKIEILIVGAVG
jgi:hypothetical protein